MLYYTILIMGIRVWTISIYDLLAALPKFKVSFIRALTLMRLNSLDLLPMTFTLTTFRPLELI